MASIRFSIASTRPGMVAGISSGQLLRTVSAALLDAVLNSSNLARCASVSFSTRSIRSTRMSA